MENNRGSNPYAITLRSSSSSDNCLQVVERHVTYTHTHTRTLTPTHSHVLTSEHALTPPIYTHYKWSGLLGCSSFSRCLRLFHLPGAAPLSACYSYSISSCFSSSCLLLLLCAWATSKSPHKPPNDFVALGRQPARPQKQPKTRTSGVSCAESRIYPPVLSYSPPFPNPPALSVCAISECRLNLNLPRLQGGGREREAWHDCLLFGPLIFCFFACLASARCFLSNGFSIIIPNSKL